MRPARRAVLAIVADLSDRRGLGQEWSALDREMRAEILKEWVNLVEEALVTVSRKEAR